MAVDQFAKLQKLDPYRLENMDTYSNLLYVKVGISWCKQNEAVILLHFVFAPLCFAKKVRYDKMTKFF